MEGFAGLVTALITTAATVGTSLYQGGQQAKSAKSARGDAQNLAKQQALGNLSKDEAQASASKRAFRKGVFLTSPTGISGSGTRGRSRLMGA